MKLAPLIATVLVLCLSLPGARCAKPKKCVEKDGKKYKVGQGYLDTKTCIQYKCVKKGNKVKMMGTEKPRPCSGTVTTEIPQPPTPSPEIEKRLEDIEKNIQALFDIMTAIQTTSNKHGTCLADVSSLDCPYSTNGKISVANAIMENREAIEDCCEESVYFIAGGGYDKTGTELWHPTIENLDCSMSPPSLDNNRDRHSSFYYDNTIYLCLGWDAQSTCMSYKTNGEGWKTHSISGSRTYGHSTVILRNTLYIIGGGKTAVSTPLPLTQTPVLTPVPNLSYRGSSQCAVKVDEDNLVIIGGHPDYSAVTQYNIKTKNETKLPSLKRERSFHACVTAEMNNKKWIIVAGGFNNGGDQITPEMLEWGASSWGDLENLNEDRDNFAMIQTKRGIMAVAGGYNLQPGLGYYRKTVELLDWSTKKWSLVQPSLKEIRGQFGDVVKIPASMFNCTIKGN